MHQSNKTERKNKKNRSKILPLVQVLKYAVDTMKPDMTTKAIECVMDSETYQMRVLKNLAIQVMMCCSWTNR